MKRLRRVFVRAALLSSLILLASTFKIAILAQQTPNSSERIARVSHDADSLVLDVTVTDKDGNYMDGLDKSAFALSDNKIPQEITFFAGGDEPASIGVIFDLSGSMIKGNSLAIAHNAVLRFMQLSHPGNDYFVITFATRPLVLVDWTRDSKAAAAKLSRYYFSSKNTSGDSLTTALYDSLYLGVEKMREGAHPKQAILLISDGQDSDSRYTFSQVRERLKETGVMVYTIYMSGDNYPNSALELDGQATLDELSAISGGEAYIPKDRKETDEVFDRIAGELRHQYVLGFKPSKDKADGKWHQIKVKVTPPLTAKGKKQSVFVRYRDGYYSLKHLR